MVRGLPSRSQRLRRSRLIGTVVCIVVLVTSERVLSRSPNDSLLIRLTFVDSPEANTETHRPVSCPNGQLVLQSIDRADPNGGLRWTAQVPNCLLQRPVNCEPAPRVQVWHVPEQRKYDYDTLGIHFVRTSGGLAFAATGGMFALAAGDGRLRFEWTASKSGEFLLLRYR